MCEVIDTIQKNLDIVEGIMTNFMKETEISRESIKSSKDLFYVTNIDTDEIYFVNDTIKNLFGDDLIGKKCFEIFHDSIVPCDFCTNSRLLENPNEEIKYPFYNKKINKLYLIIDSMKIINGKRLRYERAIEIDDLVHPINSIANKYNLYD